LVVVGQPCTSARMSTQQSSSRLGILLIDECLAISIGRFRIAARP
jgi:hypothetical protein